MSELAILTSPPSSGKTHWIGENWRNWGDRIIYLSPLRALCEEVWQKWSGPTDVYRPESCSEAKELFERPPKRALVVMTVELFMGIERERVQRFFQSPRSLVVLDEFHLFKMWGEDFRPQLLEVIYLLADFGCDVLGLSASLTSETKMWIERDMAIGFNRVLWVDRGNMCFRRPPSFSLELPFAGLFNFTLAMSIILAAYRGKSVIIFCRYRHRVAAWVEYLSPWITVEGCVGGQTQSFMEKLKKYRPTVIIGTSCLGHGVNLPSAQAVFVEYREQRRDMRLQMLSRGGRRGERFFTVERVGLGAVLWSAAKKSA